MIKIILGMAVIAVVIIFFVLAKAAGMADRQLEELQRITAEREAGAMYGN